MKDMRIAAVSYQPEYTRYLCCIAGRPFGGRGVQQLYVISSRNTALQGAATSSWLSAVGGVVRSRYSDWAARRREMAVARALYYATDVEHAGHGHKPRRHCRRDRQRKPPAGLSGMRSALRRSLADARTSGRKRRRSDSQIRSHRWVALFGELHGHLPPITASREMMESAL